MDRNDIVQRGKARGSWHTPGAKTKHLAGFCLQSRANFPRDVLGSVPISMASGMKQTYRLDLTRYDASARRNLWRGYAVLVSAFVLSSYVWFTRVVPEGPGIGTIVLYAGLVLVTSTLLRGIRMGIAKGRETWASYELVVSEDALERRVATLETVTLRRTQVTHVFERLGEGLMVNTAEPQRFIFIPAQLESFDKVRSHLASWKTIAPQRKVQNQFIDGAFLLLWCVAFAMTVGASSFRLAMVAGSVVVLLSVLSMVEVVTRAHLSRVARVVRIVGFALVACTPFLRLLLHQAWAAYRLWETP